MERVLHLQVFFFFYQEILKYDSNLSGHWDFKERFSTYSSYYFILALLL